MEQPGGISHFLLVSTTTLLLCGFLLVLAAACRTAFGIRLRSTELVRRRKKRGEIIVAEAIATTTIADSHGDV